MYEGNPLHIWPNESSDDQGSDAPLTRLSDRFDKADPAFSGIMRALLPFLNAKIELTDETIELVKTLGRAEHDPATRSTDGYKAARLAGDTNHEPVVYYVRRGALVKIGTTNNMHRRMTALLPEEVLATEPGGQGLEGERHRQFSALRVPGQREWFHAGPALQQHVLRVRALHGTPEPSLPTLPS
ncbi:GIY-YIG nuclease family protein [Streptomyces antarcticus]|uniref:GIY-YIG nuclease family protein n=1 Tax=Streptomyces antarcticus TaxID=2996458 RepID=UPI00226FE6D1|nr:MULTISPECIES: GIY-YIG nuclease family protein [unclassified Streptomyces]MCY0943552.1 GIY-YIG nuclease family protein [Streptomyces sp. H34-AA3]MCZ4083539.1 GIY-YIG nuclease family protein [Streptomyces sp. H34-S5]